jgi:hypothetical protein
VELISSGKLANMYIIQREVKSFGLDVLELLGLVNEVVGVGLGHEAALVRLLDKVFIALLLGKCDGVFLRLKLQVCSLHVIGGRLPPHERVLPTVTSLQDIPVHAPMVLVPGTRLCCGLGRAVDAAGVMSQCVGTRRYGARFVQRTGQCGPANQ